MKTIIHTALLLFMAGCLTGCTAPEPCGPIPQERCDWPNPAGYGLPPETEVYRGLAY